MKCNKCGSTKIGTVNSIGVDQVGRTCTDEVWACLNCGSTDYSFEPGEMGYEGYDDNEDIGEPGLMPSSYFEELDYGDGDED